MTSLVPNRIGATQLLFTSLSSTNQYALDLLSKTRPKHGTVISASFQSDGRGQIGRTWVSEPGENICLSVILYPNVAAARQFILNAAVALALRNVVASHIHDNVTVKWPNDIYTAERKIAGILIQNVISGKEIRHCVAGIGLNVNQMHFPDTLPNPTSLAIECNKSFRLPAVRQQFYASLETHLSGLATRNFQRTLAAYNQHLFALDQTVSFREMKTGETFDGRIRGVDNQGRLRVQRGTQESVYLMHDIQMSDNAG